MDAFYEEDDRILGHAADPYHRIDIRHTSRHLVVRAGGRVVADTTSPLVLYESGFAPRWYVPRDDVVGRGADAGDLQTFCPYKGVASYYDIDGVAHAAWSYRAPIDEMAAIGDLVSFEPDRVEVTLDGERLRARARADRRLARHRPQPEHRRGRRARGRGGRRVLTGTRVCIEALLEVDERDPGCGATRAVLERYVEAELGRQGATAGFRACRPAPDHVRRLLRRTRRPAGTARARAQTNTAPSQAPAATTLAASSMTIERPIARSASWVERHADAWPPSRRRSSA